MSYENLLILMMIQGSLGALDTVYYHEYVYDLANHRTSAAPELRLHALRDFIYGVLYLTLPFWAWQGLCAYLLAALFVGEIIITLVDFAVEDDVRRPWGGVAKGERTMHTVIALLYGAFLALFYPFLTTWMDAPTGWVLHGATPLWQQIVFPVMGIVAIGSGIRDLFFSGRLFGLPKAPLRFRGG